MSDLHIRKLCNALIPNAAPSGLVPGVVVNTVDRMSRKAGGLWVGGRVEITPEGVSFTANGLNRAFHTGLQPVHIPMTAIHKAWREFGWVTGIVAVGHNEGTFRVRCYGARKVAEALEKHIAGRQEQ